MLLNSKKGAALINIIAPPVFVLGLVLCAWALYLYFDNGGKISEIEIFDKKKNVLKNQGSAIEKRIEELNNFLGLKILGEQDRTALKEEIEKEKKIFLEGDEKEDKKKEKSATLKKNSTANKYVKDTVDNYILAKVWLQKKLNELKEKIAKYTSNYFKISDKEIEEVFKKLNPNVKYDKDSFFLNYPSYINIIVTLNYLTNQLLDIFESKKRENENLTMFIKRLDSYYAFLENFELEKVKEFSTIERNNLKEVCEYVKTVYDKEMRINNYINESVTKINGITKVIEEENKTLESEVNKLRNNLDTLRVVGTLKKDVFGYGGTVIREDFSSKIVVISYGKKDGLEKGHIFYVFDFFPIGGYRWKGLIEVIDVEDTKSKAKIIQENFTNNPIRTGDYLSSPFFKKGNKTRVYLFGRIEKTTFGFSEKELKEHLESIGVIVQKDVHDAQGKLIANGYDLYTDFVIKGQEKPGIDIRTDKQWREINELGIPVISLYDLLPLLGGYIKAVK